MKKTAIVFALFILNSINAIYSQNLHKGDFKVTIEYLENILSNRFTKQQLDSVLPYNSNMGWETREIKAYNPTIKDWSGKSSYKYSYSCSYRKERIKLEFTADNDSSAMGYLTIIISGYYWLDEWLTAGNNFKPNGYKVDIYKLIRQELITQRYNAGESEFVPLGKDQNTLGSIEYYHKSNFKVKLFYNLNKPIISITITKTK